MPHSDFLAWLSTSATLKNFISGVPSWILTLYIANLIYSLSRLRRQPENEYELKNEDNLKNEDDLKNEDNLKTEDDLKNKNNRKNEIDHNLDCPKNKTNKL